ncbi:hypothetical protein SynA15127_01233 [Synechococcus sp. A15-127]|nr:hypothetical protein SynA15127_01233 [Synechococcus sp. A15-127]
MFFAKGRNNGANGPVDISKDTPLIHSNRGAGWEEQSNGAELKRTTQRKRLERFRAA